ncbi:MAG TPA: hypothetical protein VGE24_09940, partial [Emticicia sp.]
MDNLKSKLNPHLLKLYPDISNDLKALDFHPNLNIWKRERFDLAIKYVYLIEKNKYGKVTWLLDFYKEHIKAFTNGTFEEGDGSGKSNFLQYLSTFESLEQQFQTGNFDPDKTLIPITHGVIIDGSHRVSLAAFYNKMLKAVEINQVQIPFYDFNFFRSKGQPDWISDYTYLKRISFNNDIRIVHINPAAKIQDNEIEEILKKHKTPIEYKKELKLNSFGFSLLVREFYKNEKWIGNYHNNFSGAFAHAKKSYNRRRKLRVIFIKQVDLAILRDIKTEIREKCKIDNHSIHINDTYEETERLAKIYLNENTIDFLNSCLNNKSFWLMDQKIHGWKTGEDVSLENLILVGSL